MVKIKKNINYLKTHGRRVKRSEIWGSWVLVDKYMAYLSPCTHIVTLGLFGAFIIINFLI